MSDNRASGILMHISSLPGDYGIGSFGRAARDFVDFIKSAGCSYWQVLPFGPIDDYNSPYKSFSAFAGNPFFIDLDRLAHFGLLTAEELDSVRVAEPHTVAFDFIRRTRIDLLWKAYDRLDEAFHQMIRDFALEHEDWLPDYALYMTLKNHFGGADWYDWEDEALKLHEAEAVAKARQEYAKEIDFQEFLQFEFFAQWQYLKTYANDRGVKIIGDMPIYVSLESADVWACRELFDLDEEGRPQAVAGVPPDYFSTDGQLWGNPLYRWDYLKETGYHWWTLRLKHALTLFDSVRIDHFRGFSAYWSIPADAETAREGQWLAGPGMDFFKAMEPIIAHSEGEIIAEDLGVQDEELCGLLAETGFPGMRVFQFAFIEEGNNPHFPHNYPDNVVAYTGTHDNNTLLGYLWELLPHQRDYALRYVDFDLAADWSVGGAAFPCGHKIIRALFMSAASLVILPIQDVLGYGSDAKMNAPGQPFGNWTFRITSGALKELDNRWLQQLNILYKRFR